jgi:hypothetical protein
MNTKARPAPPVGPLSCRLRTARSCPRRGPRRATILTRPHRSQARGVIGRGDLRLARDKTRRLLVDGFGLAPVQLSARAERAPKATAARAQSAIRRRVRDPPKFPGGMDGISSLCQLRPPASLALRVAAGYRIQEHPVKKNWSLATGRLEMGTVGAQSRTGHPRNLAPPERVGQARSRVSSATGSSKPFSRRFPAGSKRRPAELASATTSGVTSSSVGTARSANRAARFTTGP